jgi:hypothetical protein
MSLLSKPTDLTEHVRDKRKSAERGEELVNALSKHMEDINSFDYFDVLEVEEILAQEQLNNVKVMKTKKTYPRHLPRFSPSSASKSRVELFLKAVKAPKDEDTGHPFQRRWTRNSTAVHGAVQRQLLEAEFLLDKPAFKVKRLENGLPAWEKNVEDWKVIEWNGQEFVLFGMTDGILNYKDGSQVGFEYKTKSNSVAQIKQLKEPNPSHKLQCVAYSILFGVDEWLLTYESVAKDKWTTNENARPDFKIFYVKVTESDRKRLLNKWSEVAEHVENGELPENDVKDFLFFPYKKYYAELMNR